MALRTPRFRLQVLAYSLTAPLLPFRPRYTLRRLMPPLNENRRNISPCASTSLGNATCAGKCHLRRFLQPNPLLARDNRRYEDHSTPPFERSILAPTHAGSLVLFLTSVGHCRFGLSATPRTIFGPACLFAIIHHNTKNLKRPNP